MCAGSWRLQPHVKCYECYCYCHNHLCSTFCFALGIQLWLRSSVCGFCLRSSCLEHCGRKFCSLLLLCCSICPICLWELGMGFGMCCMGACMREAALRRRLSTLTRSRSFVAFEKPSSKLVTYCTGGTSKRVTNGITAIKCTILRVGSIYIFFGLEHFRCTTCGVLFGTDLFFSLAEDLSLSFRR